jgi:hypothetical protein
MVKILIISPNTESASDFYRCLPFSYIVGVDIDIIRQNKGDSYLGWSKLSKYDIIYLSRPYLPSHLNTIHNALTLNKKVWVDYDDLLTNVSAHNPAFSEYKDAAKTIEKIVSLASIVTVTTPELKNQWQEINKKVHVIPNAFNEHVMRFHPYSKENKIIWRGSPTHCMDLYIEADALKQFDITYIGYYPFFIPDEKITHIEFSTSLMTYMHLLSHGLGQTFIFPLEDTLFNKCKSNIGWLEATSAGAATIGLWDIPAVINYKKEGLAKTISDTINNYDFRMMKYEESVALINEKYMLNTINKLRVDIISEFLK